MPRLQPLPIEQLVPETQAQMQAGAAIMGFTPNDGLTMARKPALVTAMLSLVQAIYAPGRVDNSLKRLIGLMSSSAAGCQYCVAHTANSATNLGVEKDKLEAIWDYEKSTLFTEAERAALTIARDAAQTPNAVNDEAYTKFASYFDEEEQTEIIAVIAMFGFLNRWNSTIATDIESSPMQVMKQLNLNRGEQR